MALELIETDTVLDDTVLELQNTFDVITAVVGGTTYVFATGRNDDGISVFRLNADGTLTNTDNVTDSGDLELFDVNRLATVETDGVTYLVSAAANDSGVSVFMVGDDGVLTNVDNVADDGSLELESSRGVATATFGNDAYVFVAGGADDGMSTFSLGAGGALTNLENVTDDGTLFLDGPRAITTAVVNSFTYLFVAGEFDDGISVFSVDPADGGLTNVSNIADTVDLALGNVFAMTTARVGGVTYLFAGGSVDYGLSVFSVGADGALTEVQSIVGTDTEFFPEYPSGLKVIELDGVNYLVVGGAQSGDIRAYAIADDGMLTKVELDGDDLSLPSISRVATAEIDGVTYVLASGETSGSGQVSVFRAEHNIIDETAAVAEVAENGTAAVTVDKLYVDDTLTYTITGGDDAALFEIDAATGEVTFLAAPDFEAPEDADGDNIYDIEVTADDGIVTEAKTLAIEVTNVGGTTVNGTSAANILSGHGEEDLIKGKAGNDTLEGKGGDDTLRGGNGNDRLKGGSGDDLLSGGKGKDKLTGGDGADAFRFDKALSAGSVDRIKDFETGIDTIQLDNAVFTRLGAAGDLQDRYFDYGDTATSGKDRVLYDPDTGWLRYDADGKGGDDAVKFARLDKNLDLSADDFLVV